MLELPFGLGVAGFSGKLSDHSMSVYLQWSRIFHAEGITNRVLDAQGNLLGYALFADLDGLDDIGQARMRLKGTQQFMGVDDAFIFRSGRRGFHVVVPGIYGKAHAIQFAALMESGHSLSQFESRGEMTLRISEKRGKPITFVETYKGNQAVVLSGPHLAALVEIWGVPERFIRQGASMGERFERKRYISANI